MHAVCSTIIAAGPLSWLVFTLHPYRSETYCISLFREHLIRTDDMRDKKKYVEFPYDTVEMENDLN